MIIKQSILRLARILSISLALTIFLSLWTVSIQARPLRQIPTGSVPTVTGTVSGPMALILGDGQLDQLNVRSGPGTAGYEVVGVLTVGERVPALGISPKGEWVQIAYPGVPGGKAWVYRPYVQIDFGEPPIVAAPATPTPRVTPTIDPTLAAQYQIDVAPTRLPTYTPPPPFNQPTISLDIPANPPSRVPMGMIIVIMAVIGIFGMLLSFLGGR